MATSGMFDAESTVTDDVWSGASACRIDGEIDGRAATIVVVPHPYPFDYLGDHFSHAAVVADPIHLDTFMASLSFSPDRVTPEAYVASVLDLVEACAWWADDVDWAKAREQALSTVAGNSTMELAQGVVAAIVQNLRSAGDNHSFVVPPSAASLQGETEGFGLLVGGRQIVRVYPNGPADQAGLQAGDIVETVNGRQFLPTLNPVDPESLWGSRSEMTVLRPGVPDPMTVTIERGGYDLYVPPSGHRLEDDLGYLELPHFASLGQEVAYGEAARQSIANVDQQSTCGWVIDLRLNTGGGYAPMVTAAGPILGEGQFAGFRWSDGRQTWLAYENGRVAVEGQLVLEDLADIDATSLRQPNPPVAVLIGPMTWSSGEMAALAFEERPNAQLFGETTGGFTTGNVPYHLFDGTTLALAEAAMTDRAGQTHLDGIVPDERVATDWATFGTDEDPVLDAATAWLREQPACASA